jgi:hypothetical protein
LSLNHKTLKVISVMYSLHNKIQTTTTTTTTSAAAATAAAAAAVAAAAAAYILPLNFHSVAARKQAFITLHPLLQTRASASGFP